MRIAHAQLLEITRSERRLERAGRVREGPSVRLAPAVRDRSPFVPWDDVRALG